MAYLFAHVDNVELVLAPAHCPTHLRVVVCVWATHAHIDTYAHTHTQKHRCRHAKRMSADLQNACPHLCLTHVLCLLVCMCTAHLCTPTHTYVPCLLVCMCTRECAENRVTAREHKKIGEISQIRMCSYVIMQSHVPGNRTTVRGGACWCPWPVSDRTRARLHTRTHTHTHTHTHTRILA